LILNLLSDGFYMIMYHMCWFKGC